MLELFPGLPSYLCLLAGLIIIGPALNWQAPLTRVLAASLAVFFNFKYVHWRLFETLPPAGVTPAYFWSVLVFAAETIAIVQVSLHAFLFTRLSNRSEEADVYEAELRRSRNLPSVDVFIPTANESWTILEPVIDAARAIDWPHVNVWVLDDGGREWLGEICVELGVGYLSRPTRKGFKAGNMNYGLQRTHGEFILSIDADFIAYPNILYRTVGFMKDPAIALVQTPGNLTNPDPVQYNLLGEYSWPEEQRVFTDVVQPARDVWDNSFCYGGTFLVRRSALTEIGDIPEDSITEDLYSSYLLRAKGYTVRYLNETLSEGLAAESVAQFIKQRCRWALGTLQCLYLRGGPLRARGLSLLDRLFFLDPVVFYLSFLWPFLILIAPAVYWWTGIPPFNAGVGHVITMLLPRMTVSMAVMYWLSNKRVVPIVSELGRVVGIFFLIPAIVRGIVDPFGHSFQVTLKGEVRDGYSVQWSAFRGFLALMIVTVVGMLLNISSLGFHHLLWDVNMPQVFAFTIFDLWLMFLAVLVCIERPNNDSTSRDLRAAKEGNVYRSFASLMRRILSF